MTPSGLVNAKIDCLLIKSKEQYLFKKQLIFLVMIDKIGGLVMDTTKMIIFHNYASFFYHLTYK